LQKIYFMSRINVGCNPQYLSDQHLIAESVEITMISGALRKDGGIIKGKVPNQFTLGTGHINFFKPRLQYLKNRLQSVNEEMRRRGFNPTTSLNVEEFSPIMRQDWKPSFRDTIEVRLRIEERLKNPLKAKTGFHKYYGNPIHDMDEFCNSLKNSKLYNV